MRGEPAINRFRSVYAYPREPEIHPELARKTIEEIATADVGEEADQGLRHRKHGILAHDSISAVHRHATPSAHRDTIDERNVGLRKAMNRRVHRVLGPKETHDV